MSEPIKRGVLVVRPRRSFPVVVCGKCLRRHEAGKAIKRAIKQELKSRSTAHLTPRKSRVMKVGCLGLCPKRAVVMGSPSGLAASELLVVDDPAAVAEALSRLLPPP